MPSNTSDTIDEGAIERLAEAGDELAEGVGADIDNEEVSAAAAELAQGLEQLSSLSQADLDPDLETTYKEAATSADTVVSHLVSAGFFEAVDDELPPFDSDLIEDCLVHTLQSLDDDEEQLLGTAGVEDNLSEFVTEALDHTDAIEENVRWEPEKSHKTSPMTTRGATEGAVYWLDDLGRHLWMSEVMLSEEMLEDASIHTQALGGAIILIAQGAAGLDDESDREDDIAKIVGGIALHTHHQRRLPEDLSWITDGMRAPAAWASD